MIKAGGVSLNYAGNEKILHDIALELSSNSSTTFVTSKWIGQKHFCKNSSGFKKPKEGKINTDKSIGFMFQNPSLIFVETSVLGEIKYNSQITDAQALEYLRNLTFMNSGKGPLLLYRMEKKEDSRWLLLCLRILSANFR